VRFGAFLDKGLLLRGVKKKTCWAVLLQSVLVENVLEKIDKIPMPVFLDFFRFIAFQVSGCSQLGGLKTQNTTGHHTNMSTKNRLFFDLFSRVSQFGFSVRGVRKKQI
jgi:hypothetical protein